MKKTIIAVILMVMLACTAYGITECKEAPGDARQKASVTAEKTETAYTDEPETCIDIARVMGSKAAVRLYSTTLIPEPTYYDLYTIEKKDGTWQKKAYIRTVEMPAANNSRDGKYRYYSETIRIDWLQKGHVYQLIPQAEGNHHSSVPFWRKVNK